FRDGASVPLGGPRQRALLAVLLLAPGRVVATDRLVELVWGGEPPKAAKAALQNSVAALRRLLGADLVEWRAPGYLLRIARDQIDATRFEVLLRQAQAAAPARKLALLDHALSMWRGTPLADFTYDEFAQPEVRRL